MNRLGKNFCYLFLIFIIYLILFNIEVYAQNQNVKVLVVASSDPDHDPMIKAAQPFFEQLATSNHYLLDFTRDVNVINEANLSNYQVFIQLHLAPFELNQEQQTAIQHFISRGNGWIGIHAAGLTGKQFLAPKTPYWQWFEDMMGKVVYSPHPAIQPGKVVIEDKLHPVTQNLPASFSIRDEWYEFTSSPRANVHVLATADESSYKPAKPMGDHPIIWTNPQYDHVLYIGIGHDVTICSDPNFATLMSNSIRWASGKIENKEQHDIDISLSQPLTILVNQVAYNLKGPKTAVVKSSHPLEKGSIYQLVNALTNQVVSSGTIENSEQITDWYSNVWFSRINFSEFNKRGYYKISVQYNGKEYSSYSFRIDDQALGKVAIPAIANFFFHQRASSPQELDADKAIQLYGSNKTVDLHGGWCDASGDVSKYFSHLAYANFMSPQQIPMVTWSMINTSERIPELLEQVGIKNQLTGEAMYGADYIMRSLSPEGYFYMTVFTYFDKNPKARRIVGLLADSKTTSDYQCAYREGGGMAVASLARISQWKKDGDFTSAQYLAAAERAFAHLQKFSTHYADDGKDNVIDDYCALMASTELWIATNKTMYRDEARKRVKNLQKRLSPAGYFIANEFNRPFWHAADAGLPIMALARFLDKEMNSTFRNAALQTIKKAIDYNLKITNEVTNPFGYARQSFLYKGKVQNGFFIPHENESGWWWQGEDARLGSLAAAMIVGGRLVYPDSGAYGVKPELAQYAENLVAWILGCNPYNICMMYGYGQNNVPYMSSMYGHGSGKGGISNGITGKDGHGDGSGIDFKMEDHGNEWRWSEQWIPHTGWFLQAITAMSQTK